jgi:RimJ/RimL family protein N-acetyltransferase
MDAAARVRLAAVEDADAIARVHLASHREVYVVPGRIPAEVVEGWDEAARAEYWGRFAEHAVSGESTLVVAERDGEVVGFASAGPSQDEDLAGGWQLYAIYLLESQYGSGLGQALIDAVLDARAASLWVLADNPRARAFYARSGFVPDGTIKTDPQWGAVDEVRLVRAAVSE